MVCDICHKNIATVHLTEIVNDKIAELHICQACAKSKTEEIKDQLNVSDFLVGLTGLDPLKEKEEVNLKCSSCGLSYADFKKKGRLGCAYCYSAFRGVLLPLLKKIHGSTSHAGKIPYRKEKKMVSSAKVSELKERLQRAINLEEYEEAARLRDEIKQAEAKRV